MTVRLHLVRHGRASAGWDTDPDPGLDDLGRAQAVAVADRLAPLGPLPLLTSPLRRCRETAAPLAERWGATPTIEPRVTEIPSPTEDLAERGAWLMDALAGTWSDLGEPWVSWRDQLVGALLACPADAVVVTHFVAINAAIGAATGDDRVSPRRPGNTSVTVLSHDGTSLHVESEPAEADTQVL